MSSPVDRSSILFQERLKDVFCESQKISLLWDPQETEEPQKETRLGCKYTGIYIIHVCFCKLYLNVLILFSYPIIKHHSGRCPKRRYWSACSFIELNKSCSLLFKKKNKCINWLKNCCSLKPTRTLYYYKPFVFIYNKLRWSWFEEFVWNLEEFTPSFIVVVRLT